MAGAQLRLTDIDERKRALVDELPDAHWVSPDEAPFADVDVLAPCALGSVIDETSVETVRCAVVCGSANNQLADDRLAERLAARSVLYAPDFIVNAGGLISVSLELGPMGYDEAHARERVAGIESVLARVLHTAAARGTTPLAAATELARTRLDASVGATKISPYHAGRGDPAPAGLGPDGDPAAGPERRDTWRPSRSAPYHRSGHLPRRARLSD